MKVKSIAAIVLVLIAAVILILLTVYYARPHLNGDGPNAIFSGIVMDSESSFNLTLGEVHGEFHIENCSAAVNGNDAFFLDSHPQYFDSLTKKITLNLTEDATPPNSTETSWVGVNFTVQFVDINDDGLVSEGDGLRVLCNQPLRHDTYYLVFLSWHGSTLCYEDYRT
jgi:hypothetical protein